DAIVTGENIYSKLQSGMDPTEASILGAEEVAVPVTFGVLTTIAAFMPLMAFDGQWGDFAKQIPPVVAPVLLFSLIESKLILPAHLKHLKTGRTKFNIFTRFQKKIADGLETFIAKVYHPTLIFATRHRYAVTTSFVAMALIMLGYCQGGRLGFVSMPTVDRLEISAYLEMPRDTDLEKTEVYLNRIVAATDQLKKEFIDPGTGKPLIQNVMTTLGGHWVGRFDKDEASARIEVTPPSLRTAPGPKNSEIAKRWQEIIGPIPEARSMRIRGERSGGGGRDREEEEAIEVELRGPSSPMKTEIAEKIEELFESFDGVSEAWADNSREMDELEISLKPRAVEVGLTQQSLAQQVRQAFYGEEAQRILRDRDDIRVMVRLP
ncbi:MAG: efflux RND transporter permease subunit, partial [Verrucomicrobiales bacterium]